MAHGENSGEREREREREKMSHSFAVSHFRRVRLRGKRRPWTETQKPKKPEMNYDINESNQVQQTLCT